MSWNSSTSAIRPPGGSSAASRRSRPAEKARPVPVTTMPRTCPLPPKCRKIAASSRRIPAVSALSRSGCRSVTTATASCTATAMWPDSAPQAAMASSVLSYPRVCRGVEHAGALVAVLLEELGLLDARRWRHGEGLHELQVGGNLEARQLPACVVEYAPGGLRARLVAGRELDERLGQLAEHLIGDGHQGHRGDRRVQGQDVLHLDRGDVLPAAADHILQPSGVMDPALGVTETEVAGVVPAAAEGALGAVRVVPVPRHHWLALDEDLADFAVGQRAVGFVADPDLLARRRPAHRAGPDGLRGAGRDREIQAALRAAVELPPWHPPAFFKLPVQVRDDAGAQHQAHPVVPVQRAGGLRE